MKPIVLALLMNLAASSQAVPERWAAADKAIKRLPPASFKQLPRIVVSYLNRRGCTVPQSFVHHRPHNVITGEFRRRGETGWAALCSRRGESAILVFRQGHAIPWAEIAAAPDEHYLQIIGGGGRIGYSRLIDTVGRRYILQHYRWYGGPTPPSLDHHGIDNGFAEKASTVLYYSNGKWLELAGAD